MNTKNQNGFILIGITFIMLLIGVTSVALNRKAGLQSRMAANQNQMAKTALGQEAAVEEAIWKLTGDPLWWTDSGSKDYTYDGVVYTRTVQKSAVSGYTDATSVSITAPGSAITAKASVRYYVRPPISALGISHTIQQICMDSSSNIYLAVKDEHAIYRYDASSGDITIVAGTGSSGDSGDGGPATAALLNKPQGVAIDTSGNLYIADTDNHRVKKVTAATGIIDTVAGTGSAGYTGDNGAATSATLSRPQAVAVWGGNVFVADTDNHSIRQIDTGTGKIDTVAGNGTAGNTGDDWKADSAQLNHPRALSFNAAGDYYIADSDNHRIRRVRNDSNKFIYAFAGTGTAGYSGDSGLATAATLRKPIGVYSSGSDTYISDTDNHVVRKVTGATLNITTVAGTGSSGYTGDGGLPTVATLDKPAGIWIDGSGRIVIADANNNVLRRIVVSSAISSLFTPGGMGLANPRHIALDAGGNLYVADTSNHRIRKLSTAGDISTVAGTGSSGYSGDGGHATSAQLNTPGSISLDAAGNIYIADTNNHCIRKVTQSTGNISRIAGVCTENGYTGDGGSALSAKFDLPYGVHAHTSGDIYVADYYNCWIRKFAEGGNITRYAGAESGGSPSCGNTVTASALTTQLDRPLDILVDSSGNGYIADTENSKIWSVNTSGQISLVAGTGISGYSGDGGLATNAQIDAPRGLARDSIGNLYFTDRDKHVVRVISAHNGFIYTLAGTGTAGYNGTDMPAISTQLDTPAGIDMMDSQGGRSIYFADASNSRIRILDYTIEKLLD